MTNEALTSDRTEAALQHPVRRQADTVSTVYVVKYSMSRRSTLHSLVPGQVRVYPSRKSDLSYVWIFP